MRHIIVFTATCWIVAGCAGCGGGLTQEDMLKHAIRRPSDDDPSNGKSSPATQRLTASDKLDLDIDGPDTPPAEKRRVATSSLAGTPSARGASVNQHAAATAPPAPPPASPGPEVASAPVAPTAPGVPPAPAATPGPAQPLSLIQRRQRTIENLTKIGAAILRYTQQNGRLFGPAICNAKTQPLLSWRVELLPYLGYQELYDRFDINQRWDSPRNKPLLSLIPDVYQSPERFDEKTNYLLPVATFTPFNRSRGLGMSSLEDGADNTVVVLEVDDSAAIPWTRPEDLQVDLKHFDLQVGSLREDGFFVVWGDGSLSRVSPERGMKDLKAILTYDGGDVFAHHLVRAEATATPAATANREADRGVAADSVPTSRRVTAATDVPPGTTTGSSSAASHSGALATTARESIPEPHRLHRARELIREIYRSEYETAKAVRDRQALAKRMLKDVAEMSDDPAGQYVLLDVTAKIAAQTGDSATAISAMEKMASRFEVDDLDIGHRILQQLARKKDRGRAVNQALLDNSQPLIDDAMQAEKFDIAEELCQFALGAARQLDDSTRERELEKQRDLIDAARKAYKAIRRTIASLEDSEDPQANLEVGRYYCLIRGEWEKGLPMLVKGSHPRLKDLARSELRNPKTGGDQVELADGWWNMSEDDTTRQKVLRMRAAYWYLRALESLPQGLLRIKAEIRVEQVRSDYGDEAVEQLETAITP